MLEHLRITRIDLNDLNVNCKKPPSLKPNRFKVPVLNDSKCFRSGFSLSLSSAVRDSQVVLAESNNKLKKDGDFTLR